MNTRKYVCLMLFAIAGFQASSQELKPKKGKTLIYVEEYDVVNEGIQIRSVYLILKKILFRERLC